MDHHRVLAGEGLLVPHPAVDFLRRKDTAGVPDQQVHDSRLRGRQLYHVPVRPEFKTVRVIGQPPVDDDPPPPLGVDVP